MSDKYMHTITISKPIINYAVPYKASIVDILYQQRQYNTSKERYHTLYLYGLLYNV